LAEGNQSEAVREFTHYRALLHAELGLEPTLRLNAAGFRCLTGCG
jgi:hypothetical protein